MKIEHFFLSNPTFEKLIGKAPIVGKCVFPLSLSRCLALSPASYLRAVANLYAFKAMRFAIFRSSTLLSTPFFRAVYHSRYHALNWLGSCRNLQKTSCASYPGSVILIVVWGFAFLHVHVIAHICSFNSLKHPNDYLPTCDRNIMVTKSMRR